MKHTEQFFTNADALAGKIATVTYAKAQKIRKSHADLGAIIIKRSTFQIRVGVEYANQAVVKEGHESGTIERVGLPSSLEKISRSRYRNTKRNVDVLAVAPLSNANSPRTTEWILNGESVPFETVEPYLYAQRKAGDSPKWFTLDMESIESLSGIC
jgi:hypothetical protein